MLAENVGLQCCPDTQESRGQAGTGGLIKKHICLHLLVDYCYYKSEILSRPYQLCYVLYCIPCTPAPSLLPNQAVSARQCEPMGGEDWRESGAGDVSCDKSIS